MSPLQIDQLPFAQIASFAHFLSLLPFLRVGAPQTKGWAKCRISPHFYSHGLILFIGLVLVVAKPEQPMRSMDWELRLMGLLRCF